MFDCVRFAIFEIVLVQYWAVSMYRLAAQTRKGIAELDIWLSFESDYFLPIFASFLLPPQLASWRVELCDVAESSISWPWPLFAATEDYLKLH